MNTFGNNGLLNILPHCEDAKKVSDRKISLFLAKNDVVLLCEEKQPRQKWLLGKIVDLIPSQDKQVRGARVLLGKSTNTVDRAYLESPETL